MPLSGVDSSTDRKYTDMLNGTSSTNKNYNAVFSDEKTDSLNVSDFFNLMVAQLTNQDFMNPTDDTQYLSQLAQFSSMSAMQELSSYSKQNYIMSLLGKNVTAAKYAIGGDVEKTTGTVSSISLVDGDYKLTVDGKQFSMSEIMNVNDSSSVADKTEDTNKTEDTDKTENDESADKDKDQTQT